MTTTVYKILTRQSKKQQSHPPPPILLERKREEREMGCYSISMLAVAMVVVLLSLFGSAVGQTTPGCAQDLLSCADYLNSTAQPSATCCTAIKQTVATQLPCLCNLFYTPGLLESLGSNITSALRIATACGQSLDTSKCKSTFAQCTLQFNLDFLNAPV